MKPEKKKIDGIKLETPDPEFAQVKIDKIWPPPLPKRANPLVTGLLLAIISPPFIFQFRLIFLQCIGNPSDSPLVF
jgi:hypothetical protein